MNIIITPCGLSQTFGSSISYLAPSLRGKPTKTKKNNANFKDLMMDNANLWTWFCLLP